MSLEEIKRELAGLDVARRHEIMAWLVSINDGTNEDYRAEMTRRIDDNDPAHWVTLDELDRRIGLTDEPVG